MEKIESGSRNNKHLNYSCVRPFVFQVDIFNQSGNNTMSESFANSIADCISILSHDSECRSIVICSAGTNFCCGEDIDDLTDFNRIVAGKDDVARRGLELQRRILLMQRAFLAIESCPKPVIVAIHGACVGPAMGLITACDIRYCTKESWFQVSELELGMAADTGTLQRLPKVIGSQSFAREMCLTARKVEADEAMRVGLVSRAFDTRAILLREALDRAELIANLSPVAVQTTKKSMVFSESRSNYDGLDHIREMNLLCRQSEDYHISQPPMKSPNKRSAYVKY
ncbi:hypothetical protein DMENIID0001_132760 [Sergentomyia squamirostris]